MVRRTLAEFVVIVVGVLVALAVDRWAERQRERATEADCLARLEVDLQEDSLQIAGLLGHFTAREERSPVDTVFDTGPWNRCSALRKGREYE